MYHSIIKFDFYTTSENRYNYMHTRGKTTKSQNVKQFVQSNWESNIIQFFFPFPNPIFFPVYSVV